MSQHPAIVLGIRVTGRYAQPSGFLGLLLGLLRRDGLRESWAVLYRGGGRSGRLRGLPPDAALLMASRVARVAVYHYAERGRAWMVVRPRRRVTAAELRRRLDEAADLSIPDGGAMPVPGRELSIAEAVAVLRALSAPGRSGGRETPRGVPATPWSPAGADPADRPGSRPAAVELAPGAA